ncbi:hypothetical protein INT47_009863 [Mucor saturninus]|uniref:Uncharacterized protein n=1 Tax=Mucor saturninus TaxID=64648 RepID=A0A8H7UY95_9FUNG|nr:hypothetical protein INT47_009863 [Mucor saturninus]
MVISNKLLLLCLAYSGHITLGAAVLIPSSHLMLEDASVSAAWGSMKHSQPSLKPSLAAYNHISQSSIYPVDRVGRHINNNQPFHQQYSEPYPAILEKRNPHKNPNPVPPPPPEPTTSAAEFNAVVQWDIVPDYHGKKHKYHHHKNYEDYSDEDDDDDDDEYNNDDYDEYDEYDQDGDYDDALPYHEGENMNGDWWKYDKDDGWKHGKKANRRVIYFSKAAAALATTTVTELPLSLPPCLPGVAIPGIDRLVTVLVTPDIQTVRLPAEVRTIAGKEHTIQGAEKVLTRFSPTTIMGEDVYLPGVVNTITALGQVTTFTMDPLTIRGQDIFGTVTQYGATQYGATEYGATEYGATQYATETLLGATVTADGIVSTLLQDAVTLTELVTVEAPAVISTVKVDVTHYLLKQTVMATVYATATAVQTVAVTSHNNVFVTLYGSTSTSTQDVVVTVRRPKSTTTTSTDA